MAIQISVVAAAVVFILVSIYAVVALRFVIQVVQRASQTLQDLHPQLSNLTETAQRLLTSCEKLTDESRQRLVKLDPALDSVEKLGRAAGQVADEAKQLADTFSQTAQKTRRTLSQKEALLTELTQLASAGVKVWQERKQERV